MASFDCMTVYSILSKCLIIYAWGDSVHLSVPLYDHLIKSLFPIYIIKEYFDMICVMRLNARVIHVSQSTDLNCFLLLNM